MRFFNETTMSIDAKMPNVLVLIIIFNKVCPEFDGAEVLPWNQKNAFRALNNEMDTKCEYNSDSKSKAKSDSISDSISDFIIDFISDSKNVSESDSKSDYKGDSKGDSKLNSSS